MTTDRTKWNLCPQCLGPCINLQSTEYDFSFTSTFQISHKFFLWTMLAQNHTGKLILEKEFQLSWIPYKPLDGPVQHSSLIAHHSPAHTSTPVNAKYLHFLNYTRRFLTLSMLFPLPGMFFPDTVLCSTIPYLVKCHILLEVSPEVSMQRWEHCGAINTVEGCVICHVILLRKP